MKEFLASVFREAKEWARLIAHSFIRRILPMAAFVAVGFIVAHTHKNIPTFSTLPTPSDKPITVLAGGDVNMGRQSGQKILAGDINYPFTHIADTLKSGDITFVNLESQLADLHGETQSPTNEYRFAGPPQAAQSLKNAGVDVVSVANNHMWDYGKDALFSTLDSLTSAGVAYTGASEDQTQKDVPYIITVRGKKIAFFAMTTLLNGYENSGATDFVSYDTQADIERQIAALKDQVDWIFVSIHTGIEYQNKPTVAMVKLSHDLIDAGADAILGGHPHVPQPIEIYNSKPIFYSLGNFAFWQPFSFWTQHSYLAQLTLSAPHRVSYQTIPVNAGWQPSLLTDKTAIAQLNELLGNISN